MRISILLKCIVKLVRVLFVLINVLDNLKIGYWPYQLMRCNNFNIFDLIIDFPEANIIFFAYTNKSL